MSQTIDFTRTYTADEFEALPEFNENYELIDGRLIKKPMPGIEHSYIALIILNNYLRFDPKMKLGLMLTEANTRLGPKNTPQPDLAFWTASRKPPKHAKGAGPRPHLAIEIWSPGDLEDRKGLEEARAKILRYLAADVPLVWAINPKDQVVEVYHAGQLEPLVLSLEDTLEGENIIPGFKLAVRTLFEDDDEASAE
jgi:Uma2 family endonuclease